MRKEKGFAGEFPVVCLCLLAMTMLLSAYLNSAKLIRQKEAVGQIARKYILRMETMGMLTEQDREKLLVELEEIGLTQISLNGTTMYQSFYGDEIILRIRGVLGDEYEIMESRSSTTKH